VDNKERSGEITGKSAQRLIPFFSENTASCLLITGVIGNGAISVWSEQYLLQAFLMFNSEFEVLMANSYLNHYHQEELKAAFPTSLSWRSGRFWNTQKT
jgi:hypothetical protein